MLTIKSGVDLIVAVAMKDNSDVAKTGLTVKITLYKLSDESVIVNAQTMNEVANGIYRYTFATADLVSGQTYAYYVDGSASAGAAYRYQYGFIAVDYMPTPSAIATAVAAPSAASIADAVWDEVQSGHTTTGTFGEYLDAKVSQAGMGNGTSSVTIISEQNGTPMESVQVYMTSDLSGTNIVTGTKYSTSTGKTSWMLEAGVYYVWQFASGASWNNPLQITVV